jgi:flagellar hook assembly protein FlgD
VLRKPSVTVLLVALVLAPSAQAKPRDLMPGVTYDQQIVFASHGPVVAHVITAPRPGGLWGLKPVLSNESILGRERVTEMQKRVSTSATVAGVNGDLFNSSDGHPTGILIRSGSLEHPPLSGRSSVGIDSSGNLRVERVALFGTWQGSGPRRTLNDLNGPAGPGRVSLFTPAWGAALPSAPGSVQVVLSPFPPALPNVELAAPVIQVAGNGGTAIPADGAVLVARGAAAARLQAEAPVGQALKIRLILKPDWSDVTDGLGGGPILVRRGTAVFRSNEQFMIDQLFPRNPRTAVGQTADGRILLVAVDGRQAGYSTGVTNFELALLMVRLGAVTASALDAGGSTTMAFEGQLLNRPSDAGGERRVAEALLVTYAGVYAPPPLEQALSPNGDRIAERQQLAYKVVRPSQVTASLVGPDGVARTSFEGTVQPGTYPVDWNGRKPDGTTDVEGRYRFVVDAVDDQGQASRIERSFWLNNTVGFASRVPPILTVPRPTPRVVATAKLTRTAAVTARIETTSGVILKTFPRRRAEAGDVEVSWDGMAATGALVYSGRYVARVIADNGFGTADVATTFAVRRLPPPKPKKPKPAKKKPNKSAA